LQSTIHPASKKNLTERASKDITADISGRIMFQNFQLRRKDATVKATSLEPLTAPVSSGYWKVTYTTCHQARM
jgi:hypothetical protein